jgi:hypothetical protein
MEFLANNWFTIITVVIIIFIGVKVNKTLGGRIHGGGCCSGTYSTSDNGSEKKELENERQIE